jgi:hypothetical protein
LLAGSSALRLGKSIGSLFQRSTALVVTAGVLGFINPAALLGGSDSGTAATMGHQGCSCPRCFPSAFVQPANADSTGEVLAVTPELQR